MIWALICLCVLAFYSATFAPVAVACVVTALFYSLWTVLWVPANPNAPPLTVGKLVRVLLWGCAGLTVLLFVPVTALVWWLAH